MSEKQTPKQGEELAASIEADVNAGAEAEQQSCEQEVVELTRITLGAMLILRCHVNYGMPPEINFQLREGRLPNHGEPVEELQTRGILLDGTTQDGPRLLLQIFSETQLGPVFLNLFNVKVTMVLAKVTSKHYSNRLNVIK